MLIGLRYVKFVNASLLYVAFGQRLAECFYASVSNFRVGKQTAKRLSPAAQFLRLTLCSASDNE